MGDLPAITGPQLLRLFLLDGWTEHHRTTHGVSVQRPGHNPTIIPLKNKPLPDGTLGAILGVKQSGMGKQRLRALIKEHGT